MALQAVEVADEVAKLGALALLRATLHEDRTRSRREKSGERAQKRRLAGAVRPREQQGFPARQTERETVDHGAPAAL